MVCLYGTTLDKIPEFVRITRHTTIEESGFADWNWLTHLITEFIYNQSVARLQAEGYYGQPEFPYEAHTNDITPWGCWFARVKAELEKQFDDANAMRVFKCCKEPPTEEVALIIYDACTLEEQRAFRGSLVLPVPQDDEAEETEEGEEEDMENPAAPIHSQPPLPPPAPTSGPPCVACGEFLLSLNSKYCTQCGTPKFAMPSSPSSPPPPPPPQLIIPIFKKTTNYYPMSCQCDHCIADVSKNIPVKSAPSAAIANLNAILAGNEILK